MEILKRAKEAAQFAYAPYSKYKVGVALELKDGSFILGCNVENISFGLSNCAERTALFNAISMGKNKDEIVAIAIYNETTSLSSPCGACRQVMYELLNKDCKVYLCNSKLDYKEVAVGDLLPMAFDKIE